MAGHPLDWKVTESLRDFVERLHKRRHRQEDMGWPVPDMIVVDFDDYKRMVDTLRAGLKDGRL